MPKTTMPAVLLGLAALPSAAQQLPDAGRPPSTVTVTVTGKKEAVVKKLDKTVYDVADMPRAANGSFQDALQATPGLSVTADGQVSLEGNSKVTVLVDGKPSAMLSGSSEERAVALQTMSGADIAGVEVITNPSAAYHADGGAIVNIVLKRKREAGARGQVQASASDRGLWNLGASGDASRGDVSAHGSVALRHDGNEKWRGAEVDWHDPLTGRSGQTRQTSQVFVHRVVESAAFGIDDALGARDTLSLSGRYNERHSRPLFDVLNEDRTAGDATVFHRISDGPNRQSDGSASLAFDHQDSGTAFKAMLQHSSTAALVDKSYRNDYLLPTRAPGFSHGATRTARRLTQGTLDWSRALDGGQLGMGVDVQDQVDEIGNYQASVDAATRAETPDPGTTNAYAVKTLLSAVYLTDQVRLGKWEALLGGRVERMALRVGQSASDGRTRHWQALDPSLHLKYALDDASALRLGYRRSLQRPDARDLDPFTTYVDAHDLSRGNPDLRPQRLSSWELGADVDAGKLSAGVGGFYRNTRDTVVDARSVDEDLIVTSKQNGGQARSVGVTASLDWRAGTALRLGADGGAYRVTLDTPDLGGPVHQSGVSGYLNLRANYDAGADSVALDAHALSAGITPLGRFGATGSVNLSWKHALSKTLSLTVNANDLFDGSRRSYRTDTTAFRQSGFEHVVAQRIYIGFVQKID